MKLVFILIGSMFVWGSCIASGADEGIPGLAEALAAVDATASKPFHQTFDQLCRMFEHELSLARAAGGIDFYHLEPEGRDVSWFVTTRHRLQMAIAAGQGHI